MHTDTDFLQFQSHLKDIERAFEASKKGGADLHGLGCRIRMVVGLAIFTGTLVSLGGLI